MKKRQQFRYPVGVLFLCVFPPLIFSDSLCVGKHMIHCEIVCNGAAIFCDKQQEVRAARDVMINRTLAAFATDFCVKFME
jgi:hypothetical protein